MSNQKHILLFLLPLYLLGCGQSVHMIDCPGYNPHDTNNNEVLQIAISEIKQHHYLLEMDQKKPVKACIKKISDTDYEVYVAPLSTNHTGGDVTLVIDSKQKKIISKSRGA